MSCRVWRPKLTIFLPQSEPLCPAGNHTQPPLSLRQPPPSGRASSLGSQNVPRKDKGFRDRAKKWRVGWWLLPGQGSANLQPLTTLWLAPLHKGPQAAAPAPHPNFPEPFPHWVAA